MGNLFEKIFLVRGVNILVSVFLIGSIFANSFSDEASSYKILGDRSDNIPLFISEPVLFLTESRFTEEIKTKTAILTFTTKYEDDPNSEIGILTVKQEGGNGKREEDIKTTFYDGIKYSAETVDVRVTEATPKIILKGTKVVIRETETPEGTIRYKGKIRAWATSYNENCLGCDFWTATGQRVRRGIVAVDPKVIPLHTKMYIPGYGLAVAEDVGGGIKGNKVDLYFEPWALGAWSARFVDVYILE